MKKLILRNQKILRFSAVFALFAVSAHAQALGGSGSPFDNAIQALLTFSQGTFARGMAIVMVVFGAYEIMAGNHHKLGGLILGLAIMVEAAPLITWLFPGV